MSDSKIVDHPIQIQSSVSFQARVTNSYSRSNNFIFSVSHFLVAHKVMQGPEERCGCGRLAVSCSICMGNESWNLQQLVLFESSSNTSSKLLNLT